MLLNLFLFSAERAAVYWPTERFLFYWISTPSLKVVLFPSER